MDKNRWPTEIAPSSAIEKAVAYLRQGEPIVFPTETVYGLGAPVFHEEAVRKIFAIKGRPSDNPLILHVASLEGVKQVAHQIPKMFWDLADRFWPGPLSLIVQRSACVPSIVSAGQPTVAIRMPSHPVALELIRRTGEPLAAPSANLSGRPSPTCSLDVWEDLQGKVPLILEGGHCAVGIESSVLDVSGSFPVLLRPGSVTREELENFLHMKIRSPEEGGAPLSPGMKYRHYAPKAKVRLVLDRKDLQGGYVLSPEPRLGERLLSMQTLFAEFRKADRQGASCIEIDCTPAVRSNEALMNRLAKASCPLM